MIKFPLKLNFLSRVFRGVSVISYEFFCVIIKFG